MTETYSSSNKSGVPLIEKVDDLEAQQYDESESRYYWTEDGPPTFNPANTRALPSKPPAGCDAPVIARAGDARRFTHVFLDDGHWWGYDEVHVWPPDRFHPVGRVEFSCQVNGWGDMPDWWMFCNCPPETMVWVTRESQNKKD
jgi:hypothetical protein